jgi:Protein of unknown function (DUF2474)
MPDDARAKRPSWVRRFGWLVLIWILSVLALGLVAGLMRLMMSLAGLTV